jgi:hypothetical protein
MPKKYSEDELLELAKAYVEQADQDAKMNPASDQIQVVVVEPNKKPYKKTIPNTLEAQQELVGGYIEIIRMGNTETGGSVAITLNEEGKLIGLPNNRMILSRNGIGSDVLVGTFFITAFNMQGDNISLKDHECNEFIKKFQGLGVII